MIARLCRKHDVIAVTDEIYEHMCYDGTRHISLAEIDGMACVALCSHACIR